MNKKSYFQEDKKEEEIKEIEDATKYGEFISSYFAWVGLEKQKIKAKQMEDMTKNNRQ